MELPESYFDRVDESDDAAFYRDPRLVVHIDEAAIARATSFLRRELPRTGAILDLMSSYRSHLPADAQYDRVVGLGMNAVELAENPQLTERIVRNLNKQPYLPFGDAEFDGCVLTVSVQYLTKPVAVVQEVARVLRPSAPFITFFSNRMFPSKAVLVWRALNDEGRAQLVTSYYNLSEGFEQVRAFRVGEAGWGDPLYAVLGLRKG